MSGSPQSSSDRRLRLRRLAIAGIPVVVMVMMNVAYVFSAARLRGAEADLRTTYLGKAELQSLVSDLSHAEGGMGTYMLTRDVRFLEPLDRASQLLSARHNRLNDILSDTRQVDDLRTALVPASTARLASLGRIRDEIKTQGEVPLASLDASANEMRALQTIVSRMIRRQDDLLTERRATAHALEIVAIGTAIAGALAGILGAVIVAIALSHREASRAGAPQDASRRVARTPSPAPPAKMAGSVLIVDDDASTRELLHRWLSPHGLELRQAVDAPSALAAIAERVPSVILCDVHMPGQDGLWLAERVRTVAPTTAIVLATGDSRVSPFDSLRKGVVSYVLKPFRRDDVLAAVQQGLRWSAEHSAGSEPVPHLTQPTAGSRN